MAKIRISAASLLLATSLALPAQAVTLTNVEQGPDGNVGTIGADPDYHMATYGQVFTAPVTGTLDSFTLFLNGQLGKLVGAVGTWNGTAAHGFGFGSPTTLYNSAEIPSTAGGAYTFTPNVAVTAGSLYVAFLTVFGVADAFGFTTMPRAANNNVPGINYFVWNNVDSPFEDTSWNYFFDAGDVKFEATFTAAVPLPPALLLLLAGLAGLGLVAARRRLD
jgi:hypothetical protein